MSAAIHDDIKNGILEIYKKENITDFFILEKIPPQKLRNAVKSYAPSIGSDEAVIFLYDDTVFGSANEGFILTTKCLYCKNILQKGNFTYIANILDLTVNYRKMGATINVSTDSETLEIQVSGSEGKKGLFSVLDKTIRLLKNTKVASEVGVGQAAASRSPVCRGCGANNAGYSTRCEYCNSPL